MVRGLKILLSAGVAAALTPWLFQAWPLLGHVDLQVTPPARTAEQGRYLVVTVRRETFRELGTAPVGGTLPRRYHARLLEGLRRAGARAVVFDLLFSDPSPDDGALRDALAAGGAMPVALLVEPLSQGMRSKDEVVFKVARPTVLPLLRPAHVVLGHPIAWEPDGVLRGARLVVEDADVPGVVYPHLGLAATAGLVAADLEAGVGLDGTLVGVGKRAWQAGRGYEKLVRWAPSFPELEFSAALEALVEGRHQMFRGATVVVGATNQGQRLDDMHPTPIGDLSGAQFIAQVANSLSLPDGRQPRFASDELHAAVGAVLALFAAWLAASPSWARSVGAVLAPPLLAYGFSAWAIEGPSLHIGVVQTALPALLVAVVSLGAHAVAHFPIWARLGWEGRTEEVCAVFFDVRGSTEVMAEARDAEGLMVKLQGIIARAVESNGGYVERTMGDGAFAVFRSGPPEARARSAFRAMLDAGTRCRAMAGDFERLHGVAPRIVAGAEMADVRGAVLRSAHRAEFSSFGRDIALAQRIESNARAFPSLCAVGPRMRGLLGEPGGAQLRPHWLALKGFEDKVEVFEVALPGVGSLAVTDRRG